MVKKKGNRIIINGDLEEFVAKAKRLNMTYRQLQIQETLELQKEQKAAAERIARRKGGGIGGCQKISSAGVQTKQVD